MSPPAWIRARISMASSTRPTFASQRGDLGRNGRPARRNTHGMNWIAQAVLNEFVPGINEQPCKILADTESPKLLPRGEHDTENKSHTVSNKVHDKDPPFNSPLLNNNNGAPLLLLRNLHQIHWDLRRCDTDTNTVDETTHNKHAHAITARLYGGAQQPPKAGKGNGITAANAVGYRAGHYGADD